MYAGVKLFGLSCKWRGFFFFSPLRAFSFFLVPAPSWPGAFFDCAAKGRLVGDQATVKPLVEESRVPEDESVHFLRTMKNT